MDEDTDEASGQHPTTSKSHSTLHCGKSVYRIQKPKCRQIDKNDSPDVFREDGICSSTSKTEPQIYLNTVEDPKEKYRIISRGGTLKKNKIYSNTSFLMKECWKSDEKPMKLIELFREWKQENGSEDTEDDEESESVQVRKSKLHSERPFENERISCTQEFHVLTEVQKAKILNVVEETIKKLGNNNFGDKWPCEQTLLKEGDEEQEVVPPVGGRVDRQFCRKFLLPWVFMKVVEMVLCHLIQITFLSNTSFYDRRSEFTPVIVTYYLTLLIVVVSLILHVSCYSCIGVQNPCYFMGVISSSVITLTTSSGIFVLLCSMEFYNSFREILVLLLISGLLGTLMAELCLFYVEVKNFWSMIGTTDQYYIP